MNAPNCFLCASAADVFARFGEECCPVVLCISCFNAARDRGESLALVRAITTEDLNG